MMDAKLSRTILAAFLATSAVAFGIDPGSARRVTEDRIECPCPERGAEPDAASGRGLIAKVAG